MDELSDFCQKISRLYSANQWNISKAREVVAELNNFLYTNYDGIGTTKALGSTFDYFSDFHKYWEQNYKDILDCTINESKCEKVAEALHAVCVNTEGASFASVSSEYKDSGLEGEAICKIRLLTANQDFRESLSFEQLANVYRDDPTVFDEVFIESEPERFLSSIGINRLSQNDKRTKYAKNIADFILNSTKEFTDDKVYHLIDHYHGDLFALRQDLISKANAGYGEKKTDMVLRDMVVSKIWKNVRNFDKINVASDVNTIKVALRTGILATAIPLVSSFLDIFCNQYSYMDHQCAQAWRRVWEIWMERYPQDNIGSPCLLDFFVYNVVGKQFCKTNLYIYECDDKKHTFPWNSANRRTCQVCYDLYHKRVPAHVVQRVMACCHPDGKVAIRQTKYVQSLPDSQRIDACPFIHICEHKNLMPPKSISILGQTGWNSAYSKRGNGGGGLMA